MDKFRGIQHCSCGFLELNNVYERSIDVVSLKKKLCSRPKERVWMGRVFAKEPLPSFGNWIVSFPRITLLTRELPVHIF